MEILLALLLRVAVGMRALGQHAKSTSSATTPPRVLLSVHDSAAHLYTQHQTGVGDSMRAIIRDSATFAAFWTRLDPEGSSERKQLPAVDFTKFDVVVAALGDLGAWGPYITH